MTKFRPARCETASLLLDEPVSNHAHDIVDFLPRQRPGLWDSVPFFQALTAASASGMLSDEDRVILHWRLLAVISRICLGEPIHHEVAGVIEDRRHTFGPKILSFLADESESATKPRFAQGREDFIDVTH